MYTLRVEERGERRVSTLVPRQTSPTAAAAAREGNEGGDAPTTSAAPDDEQQQHQQQQHRRHQDDNAAGDQGDPPSLYDEVFRAPVPDGGAVEFSAGNPRVEHINGLVHLYRRTAAPAALPGASAAASAAAAAAEDPQAPTTTSRTVCCLAIPSDMAVASFCSFIGAYLEHAWELRVLRREGLGGNGGNGANGGNGGGNGGNGNGSGDGGQSASVCMVLVEFERQAQADDFFADYNGRPFSSLEPEILCRLVYVREVEVIEAGRRQQQQQQQQDKATTTTKTGGGGKDKGAAAGATAAAAAAGGAVAQLPPAPFMPAPPGHTELPSCPVCLERLDEHVTGGIVTTVCNHQFHSDCLQRWGDTSCPVCRYCAYGGRDAAATSRCEACGERGDTWMCLICGSIGCGRYRGGQHASRHHAETGHSYALELETQRVWCYSADCFVHRLILSKVDGKLVELPSPAAGGARRGRGGGGGPGMVAGRGKGGLAFGALPPGPCGGGGGRDEEAGGSGLAGGGGGEAYCGGADGRPPHPAACAHHRRRRSLHYAGGGGGGGAPSPRGGDGGGGGGQAPQPCGACPECRADEHVKEALVASKLDALSLEYTHLLTTQLESQRLFFESRLAAAEADAARAIAAAGEEADTARRGAETSDAAHRDADRRRAAAERRLELALADARRAEDERAFLRTLNETLLQNAAALRKKEAAGLEALRAAAGREGELQEQVRDLMMALEARSMVERAGGGELEGATLLPLPQSELERRKAARDKRQGKR